MRRSRSLYWTSWSDISDVRTSYWQVIKMITYCYSTYSKLRKKHWVLFISDVHRLGCTKKDYYIIFFIRLQVRRNCQINFVYSNRLSRNLVTSVFYFCKNQIGNPFWQLSIMAFLHSYLSFTVLTTMTTVQHAEQHKKLDRLHLRMYWLLDRRFQWNK